MALRGNLRDFSLPDVFQLVQLSRKTGVLRIRNADAEGSIWFRDGDVFFAQSNWQNEPLGQRMVTAQKITPSALAKALEVQKSEPAEGRRLGQILMDEGYITEKVLEAFVQEQIQDTIFDLMRWDEGDFDFELLPDIVHEDIGLSVSIENIVMEGSRRLEEWNRIKKKVPSMEMVFKMATAPGEGTFEISLKPTEWNLLLLVDGTRGVSELARQTNRTDFEVARIVYGLFSAGLLEVATDEEVERLRAERAEQEARIAAMRAESDMAERSRVEAEAATVVPEAPRPEPKPEPQPAAPVMEVAEPVSQAPHEEPEFLTAAAATPNADDLAAFEQMMSAVLTPGAETAPEPATEPESEIAAEPELVAPAPEPEIVPEPELPAAPEPVPEAEPMLEPEVEPESEIVDFGALTPDEYADIPAPPVAEDLILEPEWESPEVSVPPAEAPYVPSGDLEADLLALGLGELPEELTPQPEPGSEPMATPELEPEPVPEFEQDLSGLLGPSDMDTAAEAEAPAPPTQVPESAGMIRTDAVEDDLDDLLRSLGTDEGETLDTGSSGVISTDAYLAEFDNGVGLSSGMSDEITALTGAGGMGGRSRPSATVTKIPEPGEGALLHRDTAVDRSLVMKIIEGIENL